MKRVNPIKAAALLAALAFASLSAAAPKSLYAAPAPKAEAAAEADPAESEAPPPTAAMQDKFRKLQKEMEAEPPPAPALDSGAEPARPNMNVGSIALQILFGLAFVLLLAVVSIRGLKRLQGKMLSRPGRGGDILEVLESCHLGPQQRVIALRMNEEVGIIGVTKEGISLLTVLKEPMEELRKSRATESNSAAFSDNLNKLLDRFKKPKKVSDLLDEEPRV